MKRWLVFWPVVLLVAGCAPVTFASRSEDSYSRRSTVCVRAGEDPLNLAGQLEHLLLSRGFDVVSESVARERVRFAAESSSTASSSRAEGYLERVTEVPSVYVLNVEYRYADFGFSGIALLSFSASLVNLSDGRLYASVEYSPQPMMAQTPSRVLPRVAEQLARGAQ